MGYDGSSLVPGAKDQGPLRVKFRDVSCYSCVTGSRESIAGLLLPMALPRQGLSRPLE